MGKDCVPCGHRGNNANRPQYRPTTNRVESTHNGRVSQSMQDQVNKQITQAKIIAANRTRKSYR